MIEERTQAQVVARRGALLAELFLEGLNPLFVSRPTSDVGYDLLVGFANDKSGVNTVAVVVKATEQPVANRFRLPRRVFDRLRFSNIPGLLLVADVKRNKLYCAWVRDLGSSSGAGGNVSVPVEELEEQVTKALAGELRKAHSATAAVG